MEVGEGVKSFRQPSTDARLVTIDEKGRKRGVEEVSSSLPERLLFNFRQTRADDDEQECGFQMHPPMSAGGEGAGICACLQGGG